MLELKPFDKEYVFDKIEEYNKKIKSNKVGDYEIKSVGNTRISTFKGRQL